MSYKGFMGIEMDEFAFEKMQKNNPWFTNTFLNKIEPLDTTKIKLGKYVSGQEMCQFIFARIFGSFGVDKNLDNAIHLANSMLSQIEPEKPTENLSGENQDWLEWQSRFGYCQILLGTAYAYKEEYVKAVYHFMTGLKTDAINLDMPYCDFIRYIISKLDDLPKKDLTFSGQGFSADNPMGCLPNERSMLDASMALRIIAEMEGKNGEVIVARNSSLVPYGNLKRRGSTFANNQPHCVDIYEVMLIDKEYNLYNVRFFFNGYRYGFKPQILLADGFTIKPHSLLRNEFEFIEN